MIKDLSDIDKYVYPGMTQQEINDLCEMLFKSSSYRRFVIKLAKKYVGVNCALEVEDYLSTSYIVIHEAISKFRKNTNMKFSTYLWWELQKRFNSMTYGASIEVTIVADLYDSKGNYYKTIHHSELEKIKNHLPPGHTYLTRKITKDLELKREDEER